MNYKHVYIVAIIIITCFGSVFGTGVPGIINYQGRLTDAAGAPVADGDYLIKFKIYGSLAGSDSLWSSGFQTIAVAGGLFSYQLGATINLPNDLFRSDTTRYLGMTVGVDKEITPRSRLISSPYAFKATISDTALVANVANDVASGIIVNSDISASAAIAASKISGTAATLSANQTFGGHNTFDGNIYFADSTMIANHNGITIGNTTMPSTSYLINMERHYSTISDRIGLRSAMYNTSGEGHLYGTHSAARYSTAGVSGYAYGVYGIGQANNNSRYGVYGVAEAQDPAVTTGESYGVYGIAYDGAIAIGVYGYATSATNNFAGYFGGNVRVTGSLTKGGGSFLIDHPLDPENKYLQHSFVESPDMMNIYNGNIILDDLGEAWVELPEWFGALNKDFRYQLTAVGAPGPNLYIAQRVLENKFMIAGGSTGMEVSWQVTGIRKDKWAEANRIQVEVNKRPEEIGKYLHPEVFDLPMERSVEYENLKPALETRERDLAGDNADKEE